MPPRKKSPFGFPQPKGFSKPKGLLRPRAPFGSSSRDYQAPPVPGDPAVVALIERAIEGCHQLVASYQGLPRAFCPAAVGTFKGNRRVLGVQFGGESTSEPSPEGATRCFRLEWLEDVEVQEGEWRAVEGALDDAQCFDHIERRASCA